MGVLRPKVQTGLVMDGRPLLEIIVVIVGLGILLARSSGSRGP
jgi:hypothetical protein